MNESPPANDDRLADLLLAWEDSVATGSPLSAETLCRECPELALDVEREIERLKAINRFMFARSNDQGNGSGPDAISSGAVQRFPTLPGYEVLEELGRGGMGVVYKARQQSLGRLVAVKTLAGSRWGQPGFVARLRQEAKGLSLLNHPNIVQVIDVVETQVAVSLVMEYVEGQSLAQRLEGVPIPAKEAGELARTLAQTLAAVHSRGLLHRDIKPANVLIGRASEIKIADFGLVKEEGHADGLTATGDLLGSPGYMAPEQAEGRTAHIDARTDVYGLGATLYEMLTGRPPFVGASMVETLDQVRHREPVAPHVLIPGIPRDLETICLHCLEKEPARRFATAQELADELGRFLRGEPIHARPIGGIERCRRWCRRRPAAAGLVGMTAATGVVIVALLAAHDRDLSRYNTDLAGLNADLVESARRAREMQSLAEENERQAKDAERQTKDALYAADINRAAVAWREEDTRGLTELLDRHVPKEGEPDRRGFEWRYLRRQANLAHRVLLDVESPQYILVYSPDRRLLAAAGKDAIVRLFEPETGQVEQEIVTGQIEVNGVAFSPDGMELATAGDDGTIRLWNFATGTERLKFAAHPGKAFQLVYTPDGGRIVSCGDNADIRVFDSKSGVQISTLQGHVSDIQSLVLSDDGKTLVSTGNDKSARVWNLEDGTQKSCFVTSREVGPVVFLQDRGLLVIGNDEGLLQTFDITENREIAGAKHLDRMGALALHPAGELLAIGDAGGRIRLTRIGPAGNFLADNLQPWQAHRGNVHSLVWTVDGSRLISAGDDGRVVSCGLSAATSAGPSSFRIDPSDPIYLLSKSTMLLTTTQPDAWLIRWDWKTGRTLAAGTGLRHLSPVASSDGSLFTAMLHDPQRNADKVQLFAVPNDPDRPLDGHSLATWQPQGALTHVRFSPDSRSIAVSRSYRGNEWKPADGNGDLHDQAIWLLSLPNFQHTERIPVSYAKNMAFSPDGRRLAVATSAGLVLWDIFEQQIVWEVPQTDLNQLTFSPNGKLVVTGGLNRLVIVRDSSDGATKFNLANHRGEIRSIAFSPDSRTLVTGADDGALKLWHVATGQELLELQCPGAYAFHVVFTEEAGRHLICHCSPRSGVDDAAHEILVFDASEPNEAK